MERKNWKYFPRKFSKKAKKKSKNNDKKYFIKSISSLNENGYKTSENIIKVDFDNSSNNNNNINSNNSNNIKLEDNTNKEKELKKRNLGSSLRKEKTINSMEKYKYGSEFQTKKNINIFKDQRMSRTVTKIEINSHDKISSFDRNRRDIEKEKEKENYNNINKKNTLNINNNSIQKLLNNETNSIITNSSISNKSQEKDKALGNKFRKNKRSSLQSNKSVQSEEITNNNISNINLGTSNVMNSSNDNRSRYSTNSAANVNKFVLNDNYFEANKVIKELASELEQSTNKKDNLASNKKIIEENFKVICNKISPLNLNKINSSGDNISLNDNYNEIFQNQNILNNLNIEENFKANTVSTEKTEDGKAGNVNRNNNNICTININNNDYDSMNKKMDIFEKKLYDLESILKEKIFEVLSQFDNLQNIFFSSIVKSKKQNNSNNINILNANNYKNLNIKPFSKINMNRSFSIDFMDNLATCRSNDDYYIKSHSVRKIAPIVEINPNNLQFSPSPAKTQAILSNKKSIEQNKKVGSKTGTSNFQDIKLFGKSDNKENIKSINNVDYSDFTQNRLLAQNGNFIGVTKWINLNRLIKNDKIKATNISNKKGLLANNFDSN